MKINRRDFLQKAGILGLGAASVNPILSLAQSVIKTKLASFESQVTGNASRNYVHVCIHGGPPRWLFDLPLNPNGNDIVKENQMVVTTLEDINGQLVGQYESVKYGDYYLPSMWALNVKNSSGVYRPITDLAQNMLMIRGCNMGIDGHVVNRIRHNAPIPGGLSLAGLVADTADTPIPAVNYGGLALGYKSLSGVGYVPISPETGSAFANTMFSAFSAVPGSVSGREAVVSALNSYINTLGNEFASVNPHFKSLMKDRENAIKLFRMNFDGLSDEINNLNAKYKRVINQAVFELKQEGLDDKPLMTRVNDRKAWINAEGTSYIPNAIFDYKSTINENTNITPIAICLSACDFLFRENLSTSFTISCAGSLDKVSVSNCLDVTGNPKPPNPNLSIEADPHAMGAYSNVFYNSLFFRGLAAGLLELTDTLKNNTINGESIFNNTVIHIAGEFSRSPRNDGSGSDHGWQAANTSIISGMIDKLEVIGNISTEGVGDVYTGTWGVSAPNEEISGRNLNIGNLTSTVATMLNVNEPSPNDISLVNVKDGRAETILGRPQNIEGYKLPV